MISAVSGRSALVVDSRIAMAPTGPIPGSTPTNVPINPPMSAARRFSGVIATENP
jgi:hypothetical protein